MTLNVFGLPTTICGLFISFTAPQNISQFAQKVQIAVQSTFGLCTSPHPLTMPLVIKHPIALRLP